MRYAQALQHRQHYFIKCVAAAVLIFLVAWTCGAQAKPTGQASEEQWTQELKKHPALLAEFGRLFLKLQSNVQFPAVRRDSRLLPLLPEATMSYAAFPNYGDAAHQTVKIFRQELEESAVLREWWQHGEVATAGPKVEDALEKFYQLSQYLGEAVGRREYAGGDLGLWRGSGNSRSE